MASDEELTAMIAKFGDFAPAAIAVSHLENVLLGRRSGKSFLADSLADFLKTPGYNSDDAAKAGGHHAYMKQLKEEKEMAVMKNTSIGTGTAATALPEWAKDNIIKVAQAEAVSEETATVQDMVALGEALTSAIKSAPRRTFMLTSPETLTVKKDNGQWSKKAHIGGEEFVVDSAYFGKRGELIYVFTPDSPESYVAMEMTEKQATRMLGEFGEYAKSITSREFKEELAAVARKNLDEKEKAKNSEKAELYADIGFGSW